MKFKITAAYILGITMGIIIMMFLSVIDQPEYKQAENSVTKKDDSEQNNTSMQIKVLNQQNARLEKQLEVLKEDNKSDETPVKLVIENGMSNSDIAELIVSNGIYPYENDLLLILEMLSFNKEKASSQLETMGIVQSADLQLKAYTLYEEKRDEVADSFIKNNLIQDQKSFEKLIYIFKDSTNIKPGEKIFKKNISLREIVDILVN